MIDRRRKNVVWAVQDAGAGISWDGLHAAVLMDIRDELQTLNKLLHCSNFTGMPHTLTAIKQNTKKVKRKPRAMT